MKKSPFVSSNPPEAGPKKRPGVCRLDYLIEREMLARLPVLSVRNGTTDYIDIIDNETMVDDEGKTVCLGVFTDKFRRCGACMHVEVTDIATKKITENALYTIFNRYSDTPNPWVMCISHYYPSEHAYDGMTLADIIRANTAISPYGDTILKNLFSAHFKGSPYITEDKMFSVKLVV